MNTALGQLKELLDLIPDLDGTGTSIVTSPDTYARPAPSAMPGRRHHHGVGHT